MIRVERFFLIYLTQAFVTNVDFQVVGAFGNLVEGELLTAGAELTLAAAADDGIGRCHNGARSSARAEYPAPARPTAQFYLEPGA